MDRRTFSLFAAGLCGSSIATLAGCGGGGTESPVSEQGLALPSSGKGSAIGGSTVFKHAAQPNPTGLRVGFWEVFTQQAATLSAMGRRPSARVSFDGWAAIELQRGVYTFPNPARYGDTHAFGETILGCINISFRIPTTLGYVNSITDRDTRRAAKRFLYAYVQWMLGNFGSAVLTIDYEIVSNYRLFVPGSEARGREWAAWYIEAAAVARQAAADLGMGAALKLQPIFNGDPFLEGSPIALGGAHNPWLRDVVNVSDFLALDSYFRDPARPMTDATRTIDVIRFWLDEFAGDRDVVVTENGFKSVRTGDPDAPRDDRKYNGTEAEQAAYYEDLFAKLLAANRPEGAFRNRLRGFHMWSITDNPKAEDREDRHFGLIRADGTEKPAAAVVRNAIRGIEADPFHQPYIAAPTAGRDLAARLRKGGEPVPLAFHEGDRFEYLRRRDVGPQIGAEIRLQARLATPGNLMLCVNGQWMIARGQSAFDIDISAHYRLGAPNTIDVLATAQVYPVNQQVVFLDIAYA